jgi:murein DD-endopeptidase MepM/ murein hydrolase activator NlpD
VKGLPGSSWLWAGIACVVLLVGLRLEILQRRSLAETPPAEGTVISIAPRSAAIEVAADPVAITTNTGSLPPSKIPASPSSIHYAFVGPLGIDGLGPPEAYGPTVITDTLGRGDSIYLVLKRNGVSEGQIIDLVTALRPVFNSKESKPQDTFTVTVDTADAIAYFQYTQQRRPEAPLIALRTDNTLRATRHLLPTRKQRVVLSVEIEANLFNAIQSAGESDQLIELVADGIFGAVIDFYKDSRKGDRLDLVFEKEYLGDRFLRYHAVHFARYEGQLVSQEAVRYDGGYYDENGKSLARMFLLSPISLYARISSGFSRRRFHPILKKPIPHLGTDYAARTGTPVKATARGRVTHAGWKGGYGKLVEIEHVNGYRTRYAHLSRISVKEGSSVNQDQAVGSVGATGRATGPHLHYELIKNGVHMDPERANRNTKGKPLKDGYLTAYTVLYSQLLRELEEKSAVSTYPKLATSRTD